MESSHRPRPRPFLPRWGRRFVRLAFLGVAVYQVYFVAAPTDLFSAEDW
jgi:hypothetical protein